MSNPPNNDDRLMAGSRPVVVSGHPLEQLDQWLDTNVRSNEFFVLGDENTLGQCLPELLAHVPSLRDAKTMQVRSGEASKDLEVCRALWAHLAEEAASRQAVLVNLGGGVVSDVGGFVAASYKRGIRFIHVPTTVMGMVDAAIGGKTAIDLNGIKNLVGVFADPVATYVHPTFLRTLGGSFAAPVVRPEPIPLGSRIAGAVALGLISPPLALLALIETGGAEDTPCAALLAKRRETPAKP